MISHAHSHNYEFQFHRFIIPSCKHLSHRNFQAIASSHGLITNICHCIKGKKADKDPVVPPYPAPISTPSIQNYYIAKGIYKDTEKTKNRHAHIPFTDLHLGVPRTAHSKLSALHLALVLLELGSLLLLVCEEGSVFFLAGAALLDAAEAHDAEENEEDGERADDDADLRAFGEGGPAVADAGGGLDFVEDGRGVVGAAAEICC
jgi:hypothetical protein